MNAPAKSWRWATRIVLVAAVAWAVAGFYGFGSVEGQFAHLLMVDGGLRRLRESDRAWDKLRLRWQEHRVEVGYRRFVAKHPDHARALTAYGCFLYDQDRVGEAVTQWQRAIKVDPTLAVAYNNLGEHYSCHGPTADALAYFRKACELAPDTAVFLYNWATACALFRRDATRLYGWDDAAVLRQSLAAFRRARDLAPQNYTFASAYAGTFHLMRQPDWAEAHAAWLFCLDLPADEVERQFTYGRLARICMHLGREAEAERWLEQMTVEQVGSMRDALRRKLTDLSAGAAAPK